MKYILVILLFLLPLLGYSQNSRYLSPSGVSISMFPVTTSVNNTTTETTIFVDTIRANSLGFAKVLNLDAYGTITSLLTPPTVTMRIYIGGTVVVAFTSLIINTSVTTAPFHINFVVTNNPNVSTALFCYGEMRPNTAISLTSINPSFSVPTGIDMTKDEYIKITAQFGTVVTGTTLFPQYLKVVIQ